MLNKSVLIKILLIVLVFAAFPFAAPAAIEFILMVDLLGVEALLLFLLYQGRQGIILLMHRLGAWWFHVCCTFALIAALYCLEPSVALLHLSGSVLLFLLASSLLFALLLWIPPILLSRHARHRNPCHV